MKTKTTEELKVTRNTSKIAARREAAEAEIIARLPKGPEFDMLALLRGE